MFSKILHKLRHTLPLRLTVWYAGIFGISSILAFALAYVLVVSVIQERNDEELEEDVEEFTELMRSEGLDSVKEEMAVEAGEDGGDQTFFRLWTADGRPLMTPDLSLWQGLDEPTEALRELRDTDEPIAKTLTLPQREHKVRTIYASISPDVVMQIGESLEGDKELIDILVRGFLISLAAVLALGVPVGWFMARRALSGVQAITRTATEIANGALDQRVVVHSQGDELDTLAQVFNAMLDRIQALIIGMREMTDNLAHDLRSPLGRIRASAEMILTAGNASSKSGAEAMVATTTEECDRLLEMINTTLDIAEAESGAAKLKLADVDLVELIEDALELFHTVAEDKQVAISSDLPDKCHLHADRQRLQRVVANLLDNALKYIPDGGSITVKLVDNGERVDLAVEDTGPGMTPAESARIFERFFRCDRSRTEPGNGLGLSLALAFVRAHGGEITVDSAFGEGSRFNAEFPRLSHA